MHSECMHVATTDMMANGFYHVRSLLTTHLRTRQYQHHCNSVETVLVDHQVANSSVCLTYHSRMRQNNEEQLPILSGINSSLHSDMLKHTVNWVSQSV